MDRTSPMWMVRIIIKDKKEKNEKTKQKKENEDIASSRELLCSKVGGTIRHSGFREDVVV